MNGTQPQGQVPQVQQPSQQQPQAVRPQIYRPEHMRNLPDQFSAAEKEKWEAGLTQLYKQLNDNPPDHQTHQAAKKRIVDFSQTLHKKMQLPQGQAAQAQARPPQVQGSGGSQAPNPAQPPKPAQGTAAKPPEALINYVNSFTYILPPNIVQGTPEAAKWLQDTKSKYLKALMTMENVTAQLKKLDATVKERTDQGHPLSQDDQKNYMEQKEKLQRTHGEAKKFIENVRRSQEQQTAGTATQQPGPPQQQAGGNGPTGPPRPGLNVQQQNPNQAIQNTEAVQAAIQAARNQQVQAVRPNMPANPGPPIPQNDQMSQIPTNQAMNATSLPNVPPNQGQVVNIKVEGGAQQPQINTAVATASHMQQANGPRPAQNSPATAGPQSATAAIPAKGFTHATAVLHAARAYSSGQTSSTPNVMSSHSHPSLPRETPNINTVKMPIPKILPPNITGPPTPVPMPPSRPTYSGGANNSGNGSMSAVAFQKVPGFNIEGEGDRVMNKRKLDELVRQVTGGGEGPESGEGLTAEVEDCVLSVADEFVDQVITAACKCAKARGSKTLEIRDIQLILERNYNIRIPGYASDEIRTVRKFQPAQGWIAKMSAIQAAKVTGGKGDV